MMNYLKTSEALLPKGIRFTARRIKSMADSVATLVAVTVVFLAGQVMVAPGSSPITFEQALGEVQSLTMEGEKEIPTITMSQDEAEVTYKRLGSDWKEITDVEGVISVDNIASSLQEKLENIFVNNQADIAPAEGQQVSIATWAPRFK